MTVCTTRYNYIEHVDCLKGMKNISFAVASVFSASYTNNPYQKLADEYNKKAEVAFDSGEYDLAVEYSILAEENSKLSEQQVNTMIAKADATKQIKYAQNQLALAEKVHLYFFIRCYRKTQTNFLAKRILAWRIPGTGEPGSDTTEATQQQQQHT